MTVHENAPVSGLPWIVVTGDRETVFRELGAHFAERIRDIRSHADAQWSALMTRVEQEVVGERMRRIEASTRRLCPVESRELDLLAEGAGVPAFDLWVYNLRGDLGRDGTGCSDVSLATSDALVVGHNEDGAGDSADDVCLVTLVIEGDPSMTVVWYPGFLPANSFVATEAGTVWGLDHLPVVEPDENGAGRHFVARHAQRSRSGREAIERVRSVPCAGGFSFNIGDRETGRAVMIENAAGMVVTTDASADAPCLWHTNHLRFVGEPGPGLQPAAGDESLVESRTRGERLSGQLDERQAGRQGAVLDAESVFAALRSDGVLNRSTGLWTFTTTVADLANDRIIVQGRGEPTTLGLGAFAAGRVLETEARA
ncbi:C45 family autoproteolytic acyltransferase/hydolase [Agromyces cerinus]|uniref:C45 family autoproteolytic acyltransferase/hydolase n=1 Tax=Agromyces cerinus TaxID=33878 RepID=UPI000940D027|nr:C45 family peptidase [Agromyces cerinus]